MADTVAWNFRYMYKEESPYRCTYEDLGEYIGRLTAYEGLTRAELESHKNSNHGWKNLEDLDKNLRTLIKSLPCFNDRRLSQLELSGKCRAFGFYTNNIFNFVFLDREHRGCPRKNK